MLKNKKTIITAALLVAIGTTIIGVSANNTSTPVTTDNTPPTVSSGDTTTPPTADQTKWQAKKAEMDAARAKLDAAIESGKFDTFKEVAANDPMGKKLLEKVTADNFSDFVEAHNDQKQAMELMQKSRDIMTKLGFTDFHKGGHEGKMGKMMKWMKKDAKKDIKEESAEGAQK